MAAAGGLACGCGNGDSSTTTKAMSLTLPAAPAATVRVTVQTTAPIGTVRATVHTTAPAATVRAAAALLPPLLLQLCYHRCSSRSATFASAALLSLPLPRLPLLRRRRQQLKLWIKRMFPYLN